MTSTNQSSIDEIGQILFTFGAKVGSSSDKVFVGKDNIDWAKSQIESLITERLIEELEHIDDPANVNLYHYGLISVKDRIKELRNE